MVSALSEDDLTQSRYVTAIVRLRLAEDGRVLTGEVLDVDGARQIRFSGWHGLLGALSTFLAAFRPT